MIEGYEYLDYIIDYTVKRKFDSSNFGDILNDIVDDVSIELAKRYNVSHENSDNYKYRGLCDEACNMIDYVLSNVSVRLFANMGILHRHGEQRHLPAIESKNWIYQHSWLIVSLDGEKWYVDATSQQFSWLYDDIPAYYVSKEKPKWFYDDRDNPCWNGITKEINRIIQIQVKADDGNKYHYGIIEYIQYGIWGRISDYIRRNKNETK